MVIDLGFLLDLQLILQIRIGLLRKIISPSFLTSTLPYLKEYQTRKWLFVLINKDQASILDNTFKTIETNKK